MSNLRMSEINSDVYFTESFTKGDIIVEFYKLNEYKEKEKVCEVAVISDLNVMSIEPNSKYVTDNYDYLVLTRAIQMSVLNEVAINPITVYDVERNGLILTQNNSIDIIRNNLIENNNLLKLYEGNKDRPYVYNDKYREAVNQ